MCGLPTVVVMSIECERMRQGKREELHIISNHKNRSGFSSALAWNRNWTLEIHKMDKNAARLHAAKSESKVSVGIESCRFVYCKQMSFARTMELNFHSLGMHLIERLNKNFVWRDVVADLFSCGCALQSTRTRISRCCCGSNKHCADRHLCAWAQHLSKCVKGRWKCFSCPFYGQFSSRRKNISTQNTQS